MLHPFPQTARFFLVVFLTNVNHFLVATLWTTGKEKAAAATCLYVVLFNLQ